KFLPAMLAAKIINLRAANRLERRRFVHLHSTDRVNFHNSNPPAVIGFIEADEPDQQILHRTATMSQTRQRVEIQLCLQTSNPFSKATRCGWSVGHSRGP